MPKLDTTTGPVRFWQPRARKFRKVTFGFETRGALASALNKVASEYLFPIDADNDSDHLRGR